ncbi:MAG: hypothetical protein ACYDDF_03525 [Thermoplasmatota archaeon]
MAPFSRPENLSFTDAAILVLAEIRGAEAVATFHEGFRKEGSLRDLLDAGITRRDMRRDPMRLATMAVRNPVLT